MAPSLWSSRCLLGACSSNFAESKVLIPNPFRTVSNEQDHHHGHGFFHLPHFHLPHFGRHKAHESHMEKHAAAAAAPSEAEGGTALASPRSATAKPPSAARGNDSDRIHLDDSHHSHLSRSDALGGSSADSLKSNDNAALRSAQRQVGVGPGAEAPKRRLSHAHAIGHEHDPIEDSQALARQPAGGNKLRSVLPLGLRNLCLASLAPAANS
jgi:hypothetical protein